VLGAGCWGFRGATHETRYAVRGTYVKPKLKRVLGIVILVAIAAFAIEGGEYGTADLFSQRAREKRLVKQIDSLRKQVDSLTRYKRALQTDAALQERIAREEFGMVREKEILYRFAEPARQPPP
jgi:cell division protein FtsB